MYDYPQYFLDVPVDVSCTAFYLCLFRTKNLNVNFHCELLVFKHSVLNFRLALDHFAKVFSVIF